MCVVVGFSYLIFWAFFFFFLFLYFIIGCVCVCCVLYLVFFRLISSRCIYFSFYLLLYGYFVTLWLVFVHFTEQDENLWIVGSTDFAFGECSQLCKYYTPVSFLPNKFTKKTEYLYAFRWMNGCYFQNKVQCHRHPLICMLAFWPIAAMYGCCCCHFWNTLTFQSHASKHAFSNIFRSSLIIIDQKCQNWHTKDSRKNKWHFMLNINLLIYYGILLSLSVYTFRIALLDILRFFRLKTKKSRLWEKWDINWWKNVQIQHSTAQHSVKPKRKHRTQ